MAREEACPAAGSPLGWSGTLAQYLDVVADRPELADDAHTRLYRMIHAAGRRASDRAGQSAWTFFDRDLYGLDAAVDTLVEEYLHSAALGLETRRRLLLLVGPVGGGKSTLVWLLKRGLEAWTATDAGAVYGIAGCPMQEDPLHLLPPALRADWARRLGRRPAGELCPRCRLALEHEYAGRYLDMPVTRVVFSEANRLGIGTFVPSDPKSQDVAELTGSLDFSTITQYGSESDPRAFRFDGELYRANRGVMEFQEMLKLDERFLYQLLGLAQEGQFKAGRFALISADQVVVGHTNEHEYRAFAANPRNEALLSRMIVIRVPYPLRVRDEVAVYKKLMGHSRPVETVHWAPGALEAAASVSVLSRLKDRSDTLVDPVTRLEVLNGQEVPGLSPDEAAAIREQAAQPGAGLGMEGLDPRFVVNRLAAAVVRRDGPCIDARTVLRALDAGIGQHALAERVGPERMQQWIGQARRAYDERVRRDVERQFITVFSDHARALFQRYLDHVDQWLRPPGPRAPEADGAPVPDEALMRSIEEPLGILEGQRRTFREELWLRVAAVGGQREAWDYRVHARLRQAVERRVFDHLADLLALEPSGDAEGADVRLQQVVAGLTQSGYCARCAPGALKYVAELQAR
ncbi:MAG: protein prkA [Thermaerobacter sp.]|nr:protein prkA [Thermaerobacter sp.]